MLKLERNFLIDKLPAESRKRLLSLARPVSLPRQYVLYEADTIPTHAHFLTSGLAKVIVPMKDGEGVECGLVGREGAPETPHVLGPASVPLRSVIEAPANALRIRFEDFRELFLQDPEFRRLVLHFSQCQGLVMAQLISCTALHATERRLARFLLMAADRTAHHNLLFTQECLARMLGGRRTTITLIAQSLQQKGLISYCRGHVSIIDRPCLEVVACECYPIVSRLYQNLLLSLDGHA